MKSIHDKLDDIIKKLKNNYNRDSIITALLNINVYNNYSLELHPKIEKIKKILYKKSSDNILLDFLSNERIFYKKDTWIVFGLLDSITNDNTDSITFFKYLLNHGIPSKYVVNQKSISISKLKNYMHNVILCNGDCKSDFEFIEKTKKYLLRAKVVICENSALNKNIKEWLKNESQLEFVFMLHGVTFHSNILKQFLDTLFNLINVSSEKERDIILQKAHNKELYIDRVIIAGLPRFDLYHNNVSNKTIFIMFTWRLIFSANVDIFKKSKYLYNLIHLTNLLSSHCLTKNMKFAIGLHHHMTNTIKNIHNIIPNKILIIDNLLISKYIQESDMLITDFSSVAFDFLFLRKPVIYWLIDKNDINIPANNHDDGVKMRNAEEFLVKNMFNVVYNANDVINLIQHYNNMNYKLEEEYIQKLKHFFKYESNICEKLFNKINEVTIENTSK